LSKYLKNNKSKSRKVGKTRKVRKSRKVGKSRKVSKTHKKQSGSGVGLFGCKDTDNKIIDLFNNITSLNKYINQYNELIQRKLSTSSTQLKTVEKFDLTNIKTTSEMKCNDKKKYLKTLKVLYDETQNNFDIIKTFNKPELNDIERYEKRRSSTSSY
jgi:hypothetical protein